MAKKGKSRDRDKDEKKKAKKDARQTQPTMPESEKIGFGIVGGGGNGPMHAHATLAQRGARATGNVAVGISGPGGGQLLLDIKGAAAAGYTTTFPIGLQVA